MFFCFVVLSDNFYILSQVFLIVKNFFEIIFIFFSYIKRRKRDLNPRAGYPTYTLSRGASSAS